MPLNCPTSINAFIQLNLTFNAFPTFRITWAYHLNSCLGLFGGLFAVTADTVPTIVKQSPALSLSTYVTNETHPSNTSATVHQRTPAYSFSVTQPQSEPLMPVQRHQGLQVQQGLWKVQDPALARFHVTAGARLRSDSVICSHKKKTQRRNIFQWCT